MRLIQSIRSSIWLVVTPAAGPSPDNRPTMSIGPGATGRRDSDRRTVDDAEREDSDVDPDADGLRRTNDPAIERRIDGAGSKPFSSMAAMASALIESEPLTEFDRRIVALRRRAVARVRDDAGEGRFADATDVEATTSSTPEPVGDDVAPLSDVDARPVAAAGEFADVGAATARSEDGERTRGATGRSVRAALR